jgi:hypothetical protein
MRLNNIKKLNYYLTENSMRLIYKMPRRRITNNLYSEKHKRTLRAILQIFNFNGSGRNSNRYVFKALMPFVEW